MVEVLNAFQQFCELTGGEDKGVMDGIRWLEHHGVKPGDGNRWTWEYCLQLALEDPERFKAWHVRRRLLGDK